MGSGRIFGAMRPSSAAKRPAKELRKGERRPCPEKHDAKVRTDRPLPPLRGSIRPRLLPGVRYRFPVFALLLHVLSELRAVGLRSHTLREQSRSGSLEIGRAHV